ncbi:ABC transporter permease subunit [Bacillus sp. JJ722]|uniref:ABC transporter permease subunit n=1 Tax=Bacillus sp. JJ722 TaxID=3122973 RepID=UPI002FFDC278
MNVTWLEMKKALLSPTILILLVMFIVFNIYTVVSDSYKKDELKVANDIVKQYGVTFNDEILKTMQKDLNADVQKLDAKYEDAETFLKEMTFEKHNEASEEKQKEIDRISLMQSYITIGEGLDERYAELDIEKLKEATISTYQFTGATAEYIDKEFEKLNDRFDQMKETEEYKQWFFLGEYKMHSELFRGLLKNIALQGVLLVVLLSALITNYEFEHRTQLVTYATKRGRHLMRNKLVANMLSTFIVLIPLFGLSLLAFFTVYDYSGLWRVHISSGLNWEYKWPYITWWPIELWQYLLLAVFILVVTLLIVSLLTFAIGTLVKNSYLTWIICILFLASLFIVPSFFTGLPILLLAMHFNITLLLLNPHMYFSGRSNLTMMEQHELWTLTIWMIFSLLCSYMALRYFNRKDIV